VQAALSEARQTLRNIKAVDVVSTGLRGDNLEEWRAENVNAALIELADNDLLALDHGTQRPS
jgi:flavin-binding protein dodecin